MAVVDCVWPLPLVASRQHGRFSLRDIEISRGQVPPGPLEAKADEAAVRDAFAELPLEDLTALDRGVADAISALNSIDARMRSEGGPEDAPDFAPLQAQLAKIGRVFREQLAGRSDGAGAPGAGSEGGGAGQAGYGGGAIKSRQDAIRAMDAVSDYFRRNEPSSPVPLLIERAKSLVAKGFLEVLADLAPDALAVARLSGGPKEQ
jgi:type VI secretion system protein ImpA